MHQPGIEPAANPRFHCVFCPKACPQCVPSESDWEHTDRQPPEACRVKAAAGSNPATPINFCLRFWSSHRSATAARNLGWLD